MNDPNEDGMSPEEVLKGIKKNSLDIYSPEEVSKFVSEWSDIDGFVADLERVAELSVRQKMRPEEIFEILASTKRSYTVEELVEFAEEWSNEDWEDYPNISDTGEIENPDLGSALMVPRQDYFIPLSDGYIGETGFSEDGKSVWLQEHSDGWFQTEVEPVEQDEFRDLFRKLEILSPVNGFLEVAYRDEVYFLDSEDLNYYFGFKDRFDEFNDEIYRVEADFGDFIMEANKIPKSNNYGVMVFSGHGRQYHLNAYEEIFSNKMTDGIKTRLNLPQSES